MSYILNNDKIENFECKLQLEGASLNNSNARILIECGDYNLLYYGKIDENGKCQISINNLKSLFPKEINGKIKLEVIADDTYFSPWQDDVTIKPSKILTIENVVVGDMIINNKPKIKNDNIDHNIFIKDIVKLLKEKKLNKNLILTNKNIFYPIIENVIKVYYDSINLVPKKEILNIIINTI